MITVNKVDPESINRCQGCGEIASLVVTVKRKRFGTGSLMKPVVTILHLCEDCSGELCEKLPNRKPELIEQQFQGDYK
jgi:hypothetical protein